MEDEIEDDTAQQILCNLEELNRGNPYSLYQRRYPRRLPKLDNSPRKCSKQKVVKSKKFGASPTPLEEAAMVRKEREKVGASLIDEMKKISLEDFNEEDEELERDIVLIKPITIKKPPSQISTRQVSDTKAAKMAQPLGKTNSKMNKSFSKLGISSSVKPASSRCPSPRTKSEFEKRLNSIFERHPVSTKNSPRSTLQRSPLTKSPQRRSSSPARALSSNGTLSPIAPMSPPNSAPPGMGSPRWPRSQSLFLPNGRPFGAHNRRSSSPHRNSLIPSPKPFSINPRGGLKQPCSNCPARKGVRFVSPPQAKLGKRTDSSTRNVAFSPRNKKVEDLNVLICDCQRQCDTTKETVPSVAEVSPVVKEPVVVDKTSREYFFNNSLETDNQMEWLEAITPDIPPSLMNEPKEPKGELISFRVAYTLRMLLFGSCLTSFSPAWREQTLVFYQPGHYALKFHKDGPVEVMASLQAHVLKNLVFPLKEDSQLEDSWKLTPNPFKQKEILLVALCDMIWSVGQERFAIIALLVGESHFVPEYTYINDKITEKMVLFKFFRKDDLSIFLQQKLELFQDSDFCGCICLLYSLILTRGLANFYEDCSEMKQGVLEFNETQERSQSVINLCLYGKAVPNNFNRDTEVYDKHTEKMILCRGIEKRSIFGFLTYAEHVDKAKFEVGSCLKTPRYPIWVCNNNNTVSVLFSTKRGLLSDWKLERRFDLHVFQGVPKHIVTSEIDVRLTIDTIQVLHMDPDEEDISTLEETIRTKWCSAVIKWNGFTRF